MYRPRIASAYGERREKDGQGLSNPKTGCSMGGGQVHKGSCNNSLSFELQMLELRGGI